MIRFLIALLHRRRRFMPNIAGLSKRQRAFVCAVAQAEPRSALQ
jgi:hypothetical protein